MERALRNREPALALALLAELDERFPSSALQEERRASSVMAHCQLRSPGAAERAATFLGEHGASVAQSDIDALAGCTEVRGELRILGFPGIHLSPVGVAAQGAWPTDGVG